MTALDRLRDQVADLTVSYPDGGDTHPCLYAQLLNSAGRTLKAAQTGGRRSVPGSRPPMDLACVDLLNEMRTGAIAWSWCFGGNHRHPLAALKWLPDAAAALDEGDARLHGSDGLYGAVSRWHGSAQVVLGWTEPAQRYPAAICPDCGAAGTIRGRPRSEVAWCVACRAKISALGYAAILDETG